MRPVHTARWRRLSARVVAEEPLCRLGLLGCTGRSEVGDHIIPVSVAPRLAFERSNVQGACSWCNNKRGNRDLAQNTPARALSFFE